MTAAVYDSVLTRVHSALHCNLCANMLVNLGAARSASWALGRALYGDAPDLPPLTAPAARVVCSENYSTKASANIQVHGGIGFTWDHGAHLHLKRSRGSAVPFGTPKHNRVQLAALLPALAHEKGSTP